MNTKKYLLTIISLTTVGSLALGMTVSAATTQPASGQHRGGQLRGGMMRGGQTPGVVGTVSAKNGNIITVRGKQGSNSTIATTYTVDATNAKIKKDNTAGTISSIAVNDTIFVQGTVSGTNVTATSIRDGQMSKGGIGKGGINNQIPTTQGNGQPIVAGKISSISGTTLTITNNSNAAYTINASSAKVTQGQNTIAVSDLKINDTVIVQGTVNDTLVVAASIIDQTKPANATTNSVKTPQSRPGFFSSISQSLLHFFGF